MQASHFSLLSTIILIVSAANAATQSSPGDLERAYGSSRIVGGRMAGIDEFPFMVLLVAEMDGILITPCGGSLIAPDTVLTAAHCFRPSDFTYKGVLIGDLTPWNSESEGEFFSLAQDPIPHPDFDPNALVNDVMILRLNGKSSFQPIELVFENASFDQLRRPWNIRHGCRMERHNFWRDSFKPVMLGGPRRGTISGMSRRFWWDLDAISICVWCLRVAKDPAKATAEGLFSTNIRQRFPSKLES